MGTTREEYGETLQERRVPTPEYDRHKRSHRKSKGPYVVAASSFRFMDLPSYFMVMTLEAAKHSAKRTYWAQHEIWGTGENWTENEARDWRRFMEKEYKNDKTRKWATKN